MNTELRTLTDSEIDFVSGAAMTSSSKPGLVNINVDPIINVPVFSFNGIGNGQIVGNQNIGVGGSVFLLSSGGKSL